jgi:hypothetical protein
MSDSYFADPMFIIGSQHLIRREKLVVPQSARDVFALLAQGEWMSATLADRLKRMVGFRNIAVHDCQSLQLPITNAILKHIWMSFCNTVKPCCGGGDASGLVARFDLAWVVRFKLLLSTLNGVPIFRKSDAND